MLGGDLRLRLQEDYRRLRAWAGSEASITGGLQEASCLDGTRGFDYRRTTGGLVLGWDLRLRPHFGASRSPRERFCATHKGI